MHPAVKPLVFAACLLPLGWLVYATATGGVGPDPAEVIMHVSGEWGLRILALTLALPLLRQLLDSAWPMRLRRMLGLFAFFYACLHLASFAHFYVGWSSALLVEEVIKRPYITAGFLAWLLLLPLAFTSTRGMQRRLGKRWRQLHRLVYPAAVLACVHLVWQVRSDIAEALVYALIFALLLGWRLLPRRARQPLSFS